MPPGDFFFDCIDLQRAEHFPPRGRFVCCRLGQDFLQFRGFPRRRLPAQGQKKQAADRFLITDVLLDPLLEAFPGWDRSWVRLSAGKVKILLLRSGKGIKQPSPAATAWEGPTVKALAAALCPQQAGIMTASERSHWQRDGEIYARYLVSLLGAAMDFLQQEQM